MSEYWKFNSLYTNNFYIYDFIFTLTECLNSCSVDTMCRDVESNDLFDVCALHTHFINQHGHIWTDTAKPHTSLPSMKFVFTEY